MERVFSAAEARASLSQILAEAGFAGRAAIIQRNNKPIAVVIGYEQYQELVALRERQAKSAPEPTAANVEPAAKAAPAARKRKR